MNPFRPPTPETMVKRILDQAERELIHVSRLAEYYTAMEAMLNRRIIRLRADLMDIEKQLRGKP